MVKISQSDIARDLNLSRVTVTKALQDHPDISLKTRQLVKSKATELGYIPDFIGRSLSQKKTLTIGIVLPKIAHSFFAYSVECFFKAAQLRGYNIIPTVSFEDSGNEMVNIRTLLSMRVDGLIIDISSNTNDLENFEFIHKTGTQYLFYDRYPVQFDHGAVVANNQQLAKEMTLYLIEKGYKKIMHLGGPSFLNISYERRLGYEQAMMENNLLQYLYTVSPEEKAGYDALKKLYEEKALPEAIFAFNDSVALGVYKACVELGLEIPGDIALAGFGDIEAARLIAPSLTTVKMPVEKMAAAAINILIDGIENGGKMTDKIIFTGYILKRDSV